MGPESNALSVDNILGLIEKSLPRNESKPPIKDAYAAIALLCHACMLAVDFSLIGLGEDHRIEAQSDSQDTERLPTQWDQHPIYAFRYRHSQSSMEYLLKIDRFGNRATIRGVGLGSDRTATLEIVSQDYISEGSLREATTQSTSPSTDAITDMRKTLQDVFISSGRISDLAQKFKTDVIQKLIPGLQKAGYEEATTTENRPVRPEATPDHGPPRDPQPEPARPNPNPYPLNDPLALPPRRPGPVPDFVPPDFEDEFEMGRGSGPRNFYPGGGIGGGSPFGQIGERDLYPAGLGPNDPLRMGPGGGGGGGIRGGGGGMHPTFDDPIFGGRGGGERGGIGGYGGNAPPGARYDPVGPGDGVPDLGMGGSGFPGGRRGGPGNGGGGQGFGGMGGRPPNPFGGYGSGDFI